MDQCRTFKISPTDFERFCVAPAVTSLSLVSNWDKTAEIALKKAVTKVVELNPILSGRLVKNDTDAIVEIGAHTEFFDVIPGPDDFSLPLALDERITAIQAEIEPLYVSLGVSLEQIKTGSKLFSTTVCTLPNSHACYLIQMSHMIGDGATYYMIMAQLQALLEGAVGISKIPKYRWISSPDNIEGSPFYTEEDVFRERKIWRSGFMKLALAGPPRTSSILVVNSSKISELKPGLVTAAAGARYPVDFLSTNDVLTAALSEICESELMVMYRISLILIQGQIFRYNFIFP